MILFVLFKSGRFVPAFLSSRLRYLLQLPGAVALKFAFGFALRGATREIAADLRTKLVDRAEILPPSVDASPDLQRGAMTAVDFQIRAVSVEFSHAIGGITEPAPVVAADAHVAFQIRKAAHAAAWTGAREVHASPTNVNEQAL